MVTSWDLLRRANWELVTKLLGTVDRSVDLSQERFHSEYYDPLELRMHCATILSTLVLTPLFFYIAVVLNKGVSFSILRRRACISLCTGTISAHIILILFGAPLLTASFKTLGLSIMFGAVSLMPLGCTIGSDIRVWRRVISYNDLQEAGEIQFYVPVALAAVGAWLGAFPIPLDWDRPWQAWPITCTVGAAAGQCIGLLSVFVYFVLSKGAREKGEKGGAVDTASKSKDEQGGGRVAVPRRRSPGRKDKEDKKESNNSNKKDN